MVLYSVVTTYHLLEAIIHKLKYNRSERGMILISHWLKNKYEWYEDLSLFFDGVIEFNPNYEYSEDLVEKLKEYFENLMNENHLDINEFDEIHVFGAEHAFGAYLFTNEIENYYWEEGAGALSKKDSMLEIFEKVHGREKAVFQYENHLGDGEADFVINRFYNKNYQLSEVKGDHLIHFDIAEELADMDETDRNNLIRIFYGDEKIESDESYALVLTEHFANLSVMTWEEQIFLYKYLVDYFMEGYKLLFKPHPDDVMYYELEFPGSVVLRTRFPAELLPYIFTSKPGLVATSSSTSIYGLRTLFHKCVEFNFKFSHQKEFYKLNRFYVALSIIDDLCSEKKSLKLCGVNNAIVDNFIQASVLRNVRRYRDCGDVFALSDCEKSEENEIWLFDEIENPEISSNYICEFLEELSDEAVVIFLNSDHRFCFYNYGYKRIWKNIYPVEIHITAINEDEAKVGISGPTILEEKKETIYVYSKKGHPDMYELKRELPNVGVTITSNGFEGDKLQIKLLEGMLEATEKRLLYYIDKEKELMNGEEAE